MPTSMRSVLTRSKRARMSLRKFCTTWVPTVLIRRSSETRPSVKKPLSAAVMRLTSEPISSTLPCTSAIVSVAWLDGRLAPRARTGQRGWRCPTSGTLNGGADWIFFSSYSPSFFFLQTEVYIERELVTPADCTVVSEMNESSRQTI